MNAKWMLLVPVFACPLLGLLAAMIGTVGLLAEMQLAVVVAIIAAGLAIMLMLPFGILALFLSWRLSRARKRTQSDANQFIEFLLGSAGGIQSTLGFVMWMWSMGG